MGRGHHAQEDAEVRLLGDSRILHRERPGILAGCSGRLAVHQVASLARECQRCRLYNWLCSRHQHLARGGRKCFNLLQISRPACGLLRCAANALTGRTPPAALGACMWHVAGCQHLERPAYSCRPGSGRLLDGDGVCWWAPATSSGVPPEGEVSRAYLQPCAC
jgi:hypothetical protein